MPDPTDLHGELHLAFAESALEERGASHPPPDLADRILAAHRRRGHVAEAPYRRPGWLLPALVAAAVLVVVIIGALATQGEDGGPAQDREEKPPPIHRPASVEAFQQALADVVAFEFRVLEVGRGRAPAIVPGEPPHPRIRIDVASSDGTKLRDALREAQPRFIAKVSWQEDHRYLAHLRNGEVMRIRGCRDFHHILRVEGLAGLIQATPDYASIASRQLAEALVRLRATHPTVDPYMIQNDQAKAVDRTAARLRGHGLRPEDARVLATMAKQGRLPELRDLDLRDSPQLMTPAGLAAIAAITQLHRLTLPASARETPGNLQALAAARGLRDIQLTHVSPGAKGKAELHAWRAALPGTAIGRLRPETPATRSRSRR